MGIGTTLMLVFKEGAISTATTIILVIEGSNKGGIQDEVVLMCIGLVYRRRRELHGAALMLTSYRKRCR
jgi:hypothetical protein